MVSVSVAVENTVDLPRFSEQQYKKTISESISLNTTLLTVEADNDLGVSDLWMTIRQIHRNLAIALAVG